MTIRHTVDSITSDALDALYDQLDAAEAGEAQRELATAREALASATTRAARAEAAIARVRAALPLYTAPVHGDTSRGMQIGWDRARETALAALDGEQPAPEPCDGRPCTGTGCSHELAAAALTAHDHGAGLYAGPAPAATHVKTLPPMPISDGIAEMYGGWPREHCGDLMPAWVAGPRSECTLRPGHTGSHADDRGARWWYDPTGGNHTPSSRVVHTTSTTPPTENP
ncbi:hypothetical protein TR631_33740 [Streptomyces rochei]|uniref:hypothetical protein n=1 Tax=Streptomyces rochei TaxID=1928 RepID=UPI002ACD5966|nr:hypothetical protein [Streptomyces rochei]WQC16526.1 hypothetical protein TR631_33740 [Streptomyces rochei]